MSTNLTLFYQPIDSCICKTAMLWIAAGETWREARERRREAGRCKSLSLSEYPYQ